MVGMGPVMTRVEPMLLGVEMAWAAVAALFAQASSSVESSLGEIVQYGLAGLVVLAMVFGYISPGWVVKDKDKEIDRLLEEIKRLQQVTEQSVVTLAQVNAFLADRSTQ